MRLRKLLHCCQLVLFFQQQLQQGRWFFSLSHCCHTGLIDDQTIAVSDCSG